MRNQQEVEAALAACVARNNELSAEAEANRTLPKSERNPDFDIEDNVRQSRYNNVTISTLKYVLGADVDPVWR